MDIVHDRLEQERLFHNNLADNDTREHLSRWHSAVEFGKDELKQLVRELGRGKTILEYGCADGQLSIVNEDFALIARSFHGIDIADRAIEKARERAEHHGLKNCRFEAMNAEEMTFDDNTFDLIFGSGIIHHLDVDRAFKEISRVLVPGGRAIFYEPLGHNPLINWYRKRTPEMRTPDEHPLLESDFVVARKYFTTVECRFFGLTTLCAVPFINTFLWDPLMTFFKAVDRVLFKLPVVRKNAWFVLMIMTK